MWKNGGGQGTGDGSWCVELGEGNRQDLLFLMQCHISWTFVHFLHYIDCYSSFFSKFLIFKFDLLSLPWGTAKA